MSEINRVAVLGSGVMGSTIAAHLANAGLEVLLLDMVPREPTAEETAAGLTLESPQVRNRLALQGLEGAKKAKPAAFYLPEYARLIQAGNFEDDISRIKDCDWVIEVVVENLEIKRRFLEEKVVPNLGEKTVLSTNTSGLSVNTLAKVLKPEQRRRFLVTHFFNPPRYMRLLEVVPCDETDLEVFDFMAAFIRKRLGKGIVFAKDTPNFIANRIGVYSIFNAVKHMGEMGLTVEQVDAVAGPPTARPKSAAFRTADLVGIDTLVHVGRNSYELLPDDEEREIFRIPDFMQRMVDEGKLGNKTKGGFYRKEKTADGKQIFYYDVEGGEYRPLEKPKFPSVVGAKTMDDPARRLKAVVTGGDPGAEFAWRNLRDTLIYTFNRIPEIAEDVVNIDNAMRWGFNWELGPFEMFDALGVSYFVKRAEKDGVAVPEGLRRVERFYKTEEGSRTYWDLSEGAFRKESLVPGEIRLDLLRSAGAVVEKNAGASLLDLGDGVFCLEFHSKMNSISGDILAMTQKAVSRAERDGVGLVVGNQGANFSVGANLMLLASALAEGAFEDIDMMVRSFQKATMALKYARVPVVAAPFGMTLGGGCEMALHADAINAFAETYMGLVEIGVGLLPAGGGTKEMTLRAVEAAGQFDTDVSPFLFKYFQNIGMAKVSMGAAELRALGYMGPGDSITMDFGRLLGDAKQKVLALAANYRPRRPAEGIRAPGRSVAASIRTQLWNMKMGGLITPYEETLGSTIASAITGGDVPGGTEVSEAYLLELEREAFLKLCGNRKTAERIQHMLKKGKPLRN